MYNFVSWVITGGKQSWKAAACHYEQLAAVGRPWPGGVILPPEQLSTNLGSSGNGLQVHSDYYNLSMANYQDDIQNNLANDSQQDCIRFSS